MNEDHIHSLCRELNVLPNQARATAQLLEEGATVPFIARYRKEATGSLDEIVITAIRDRLIQLEALDKRRAAVLKSVEEQGKLTEELKERILRAETPAALEDIYLPFRPKRRTRAAIARERGLEPLAVLLFAQERETDPGLAAGSFLSAENGIGSVEEALAGARDIIAEWINEDSRCAGRAPDFVCGKGDDTVQSGARQGSARVCSTGITTIGKKRSGRPLRTGSWRRAVARRRNS